MQVIAAFCTSLVHVLRNVCVCVVVCWRITSKGIQPPTRQNIARPHARIPAHHGVLCVNCLADILTSQDTHKKESFNLEANATSTTATTTSTTITTIITSVATGHPSPSVSSTDTQTYIYTHTLTHTLPFSSGAFLYFSSRFTAIASSRTRAAGYSFSTSHMSFLLSTNRSL